MKKLPSWFWVLVAAALANAIVLLANRNVYSKNDIDYRNDSIERQIRDVHDDVRWIMRKLGGDNAAARPDNHTPQPD